MPVEDSFPKPLLFEPTSGVHKHTIILLHGRGGSADTFGPALLDTIYVVADENSSGTQNGLTHGGRQATREDSAVNTDSPMDPPSRDEVSVQPPKQTSRPMALAQVFPHARFVFPSAPKQRATVYRRSIIRQWFDDWHLGFVADKVDSHYDLGLQITGLGSTVAYLHSLIAEEAAQVGGTRNVVLGGISQGCAASLVASLLWEGPEGLGGVVGMCGWLPYISQMREELVGGCVDEVKGSVTEGCQEEEEAGFDPFDRSSSRGFGGDFVNETDGGGSVEAALEWLRDELEVPARQMAPSSAPRSSTPVMLCHGQGDEKVEITKASEAAEFLAALGMGPLTSKEYAGVGHDFSAQMISDIAGFIQNVLGQSSG